MRWRFPDPNDLHEREERSAVLAKIETWWREFCVAAPSIAATFAKRAEFDIPAFMQSQLQGIDRRLMWEFGPGVQGNGHRLVITPESERHLRALVDTIIAGRPSLAGWEFYSYRLPEPPPQAIIAVHGRTNVDVGQFSVEARRGDLNLIDLIWTLPSGLKPNDELQGAAFVAAEALLGEEILDTWIGDIAVQERPRPSLLRRIMGRTEASTSSADLETLKARVESLVTTVREGLPEKPYAAIDDCGNGVLFELKPTEADYSGQLDLIVSGSRGLPDLWKAVHSQVPFSSSRYSRHGEVFCYLKVDRSAGLGGSKYGDRGQIEDALDDALRRKALGAVIGGGTGLRYSYVDLVLSQLDEGLAEVRKLVRAGGIPKLSWLLFFDAVWRDEWIGIYDDTPPPAAHSARGGN